MAFRGGCYAEFLPGVARHLRHRTTARHRLRAARRRPGRTCATPPPGWGSTRPASPPTPSAPRTAPPGSRARRSRASRWRATTGSSACCVVIPTSSASSAPSTTGSTAGRPRTRSRRGARRARGALRGAERAARRSSSTPPGSPLPAWLSGQRVRDRRVRARHRQASRLARLRRSVRRVGVEPGATYTQRALEHERHHRRDRDPESLSAYPRTATTRERERRSGGRPAPTRYSGRIASAGHAPQVPEEHGDDRYHPEQPVPLNDPRLASSLRRMVRNESPGRLASSSKKRPTWVCWSRGRSKSAKPTSSPRDHEDHAEDHEGAERGSCGRGAARRRAPKPGAPAIAAPKSPPKGGAAITSSVTASMRDDREDGAATGPSPHSSPARRSTAAVSCANVMFPWPATRIPTVAE